MALAGTDRSHLGWWGLGLLLAAVAGYVVYSFVGTLVFGVFLYYATRPLHRRLQRHVRPPSVAAAVSLFALALPALLVVAYALLVAVREATRVSRTSTREAAALLGIDRTLLERTVDPETLLALDLTQYVTAERLLSAAGSLSRVMDALTELGIALIHLFVMIALAFYLLRDDHRITQWVRAEFADPGGVLESYIRAVDTDLKKIFFGNILNAVLAGTIGVIVYSLLNAAVPPSAHIPAPALVGLLVGIGSLIPVVGMKVVYLPVAAVMALRAGVAGDVGALWFVGAFLVVSVVVVDAVPDLVLRPYVSGRNLHVGSVMIAYVLGPLLFGWYGLFLLPLVLVLTVHFARVVLPELLGTTPVRPFAVDPVHLTEGGFEWVEESD